MDHLRLETSRVSFDRLNFTQTIWLPTYDAQKKDLLDVGIILHGVRSEAFGYTGMRVHLNDHDITKAIIGSHQNGKGLQGKIHALGAAARDQYEKAMNDCVKFMDRIASKDIDKTTGDIPTDEDSPSRDVQKPIMQKLLAVNPVAKNLDQLGDLEVGWQGNLHIFNYLYTDIAIEPLSLNEIWKDYQAQSGTAVDWKTLDNLRLILSVDPGSLDPIVDGEGNRDYPGTIPEGTVLCRLEARYHDPLEDEIEALKKRVKDLEDRMTKLEGRVSVLEGDVAALKADVAILKGDVAALKADVAGLKADMGKLDAKVTTLEARSTAIETDLNNLRTFCQSVC
jgi:chaperonin cofactor prefoldin